MSFALVRENKTGDSKMLSPAKAILFHSNNSARSSHDSVIHPQYTFGNQCVETLLHSDTGFDFGKIGIKPKLKISQPGDIYEQEADKAAEEVMRTSTPETHNPQLQNNTEGFDRKCAACEMEEEEEEKGLNISRKPSSNSLGLEAPHEVTNQINDIRASGGSPLDSSTKEFMESRFDYDFSNVRIHSDERATRSARSIKALAYTVGNDIVFGEGQHRPYSFEGKRLLAHELAHVVQHTSAKNNDNDNERYQSLYSYGIIKNAEEDAGIYRYSTQDCKESDVTNHIDPADLRATRMAIRSAGQLARFLSTPSDPHVRDLLLKNFNDDSLSTVRKVYANFKKIEAEFLGNDYQYECEDDCGTENAYVYPFWTDVHLCMNKLSGQSNEFIAGVMVHEMSHYAADTDDNEYFYPGKGVTSLPASKAIENGDSYEGFAARI
jgi:predicted SprT family Zn-dependent metalloprotease